MAFESKQVAVRNQELKVKTLIVDLTDNSVIQVSGADLIITIGEPVQKVRYACKMLAAGGANASVSAASLSVVDSGTFAPGGDLKAIKVAATALAAGDQLEVAYQAS